jgi:hypothetical protein
MLEVHERNKRLVGAVAVGAIALATAPVAISTGNSFGLLHTAAYALAAVCLWRRHVALQVLGQGIVVAMTSVTVAPVVHFLSYGGPVPVWTISHFASGVLALGCGISFWRSDAARELFAPHVGRALLICASVGSVAVGTRLVVATLSLHQAGFSYLAVTAAALTLCLVAQATAVMRMRGWGVLLATVTGAACIIPTLVFRGEAAWLCGLAALASMAIVAPIASRLRHNGVSCAQEDTQVRVGFAEPGRQYDRGHEPVLEFADDHERARSSAPPGFAANAHQARNADGVEDVCRLQRDVGEESVGNRLAVDA